MKLSEAIEIPKHLLPETQHWYRSICEQYVLESHHRRLLQLACEAWDRSREAREVIGRGWFDVHQ
jgi:hypothetical protein